MAHASLDTTLLYRRQCVLDVIRILDFLTITGSVTVNEKKFQTEKSPHQAGKPKQRNIQPELKKEHYNTENS